MPIRAVGTVGKISNFTPYSVPTRGKKNRSFVIYQYIGPKGTMTDAENSEISSISLEPITSVREGVGGGNA